MPLPSPRVGPVRQPSPWGGALRLPTPRGGWRRFLWRFIPLLILLLVPWSGLASWFSGVVASACDAAAGYFAGGDAEIRFIAGRYDPDHPWWIQMFVKNVFTGQSFQVPVDVRSVAYIRIAVFVSLAVTWPFWTTPRTIQATAAAFALLLGSIALTIVIPLFQVLGMVRVLALSVAVQSVLSVCILSLVTYPSMAFAVPGLLWLLALFFGTGGARASDPPRRSATPASGL